MKSKFPYARANLNYVTFSKNFSSLDRFWRQTQQSSSITSINYGTTVALIQRLIPNHPWSIHITFLNHFNKNYVYILCLFPYSQQDGTYRFFYKHLWLNISKYMKRIRVASACNVPSISQEASKRKEMENSYNCRMCRTTLAVRMHGTSESECNHSKKKKKIEQTEKLTPNNSSTFHMVVFPWVIKAVWSTT